MKGPNLIIKILIVIVLVLTVTMVVLNLYPSWSQYARSLHEPLLLATLSAISSTFLIRSFTHENKQNVLFLIKKMPVRVKHINRYAGFFFIGVLCTPVTHPAWYIETPHLIFTALAIGFAHTELWFYYSGVKNTRFRLYSVLGILGFLVAFITHAYSIGLGELLAALPIVYHVLKTNKE